LDKLRRLTSRKSSNGGTKNIKKERERLRRPYGRERNRAPAFFIREPSTILASWNDLGHFVIANG
jgi:hypothetical protein